MKSCIQRLCMISIVLCVSFLFGDEKSFDGKEKIIIPHSETLNLIDATIEVWVQIEDFPGTKTSFRTIVSKGPHESQAYSLFINDKDDCIVAIFNKVMRCNSAKFDKRALLSGWNHIACTYDKKQILIYLNGKVAGTLKCPSENIINNENPLSIGFDNDDIKKNDLLSWQWWTQWN
ncbi:MAG: hypothetical protein A2096_16975 [Spirochaetes bacterium GWF1_41_5]|nr:MAG: hypothetical protein A2096_16975 [Spirochaetes bacterium GWF1_41_5]